jgi:Family of unknown function (DUF5706)
VTIDPAAVPPRTFSKDVNDYLNHYVTLADAKAAGFLAATLSLGAAVVKLGPSNAFWPALAWWPALATLCVSLALNCVVIFPRLPSGRRGVIFWEDILTRPSSLEYAEEVAALTAADIEREYAAQNYFVSDVVHRKHRLVRFGISTFVVGAAFSAISYLTR